MGITKSFERKFLLGWGRHLWNIVGLSGFIAVLTGGILFVNGSMQETARKEASWAKSFNQQSKDSIYKEHARELNESGKYNTEESIEALEEKLNEFDRRYENYLSDINYRNDVKQGQLLISPLVASYGLAVAASASISTAILSIERSTRKD